MSGRVKLQQKVTATNIWQLTLFGTQLKQRSNNRRKPIMLHLRVTDDLVHKDFPF